MNNPCIKMGNPFHLFPEEIWEMILDQLIDSQDACNLFIALPQLGISSTYLKKKKHVWLFGIIIPHLIKWIRFNWISEADLLNCRLVSKRWSAAVDSFLENQPQLRAYNAKTPHVPGQFPWDTRTYLERLKRGPGNYMWWRQNEIIGGTKIDDVQQFGEGDYRDIDGSRFHQEMDDHDPQDRSPFLSGFLSARVLLVPLIDEFVFLTLQTFGKHIRYFQIDFSIPNLFPGFMVSNCLKQLPNLRGFHVRGNSRDGVDDIPSEFENLLLLEESGVRLPDLPHLETLLIQYCVRKLGHLLICCYSIQIRKVQFEIGLWKPEYAKLFPNLTEFEVTDLEPEDSDWLNGLFMSLEAPLLAKLMVKSKFYGKEDVELGSSKFGVEDDIFQWLGRFPNIRYFNFGEECWFARCVEEGTLKPEKNSIPSLEFLSIRTSHDMSYNFLRCLPSLRHLQLLVSSKPMIIDHSITPEITILEEIQTATMYRSNIWELLPKLRTVTLLMEHYYQWEGSYTVSREGYEYEVKRRKGKELSPREYIRNPGSLRSDIIDFLDGDNQAPEEDPIAKKEEAARRREAFLEMYKNIRVTRWV